jgi:hypothetical protein
VTPACRSRACGHAGGEAPVPPRGTADTASCRLIGVKGFARTADLVVFEVDARVASSWPSPAELPM